MAELKLQQSLLDGRYEILDCLGRGSYAEIYVARDLNAAEGEPRTVVIKSLNVLLQGVPDAELERTLIENFQNEAVALDRVRHPNIIHRLGHGTAIDLVGTPFHYIVLEYMAGGDLGARCRSSALSMERALFYLEQVCSGLAHAHDCGVIHRDIKPQNLLLTADAQVVKIADFGVAKIEASEGAITRVGTNVYAAPEHNPLVQTGQLDASVLESGHVTLTPAADIYSLAKTTYTMLAGEPPRRFSHRQITELPEAIAGQSWARDVLGVLRRSTEEKPERRYQTVREFWEELVDATLPPTQPLRSEGAERRERPSSKLTKIEAVVETLPRPRFDSRDVLKQSEHQGNGRRPRIVVPINARNLGENFRSAEPAVRHPVPQQPSMQNVPQGADYIAPVDAESGRRWTRALVALLIILGFAGILLATHFYVSRQRAAQSAPPTGNTTSPYVGREVTVTTAANLRREPSMTSSPPLRMVAGGSRVRILSVNDNNTWFEVEILASGDDANAANAVTRGWMGRKVLDLD